MSHGVHANFDSFEGTSNGSQQNIVLNRRSRKLIIVNDHASNDLSWKFNESEDYGTLKPTESITLFVTTKEVIINGTSVPYRIWSFG